jgi:hypothetical protein
MARLLSDEASQYLDYAGATVTAYPFTISGWLYPDEAKFHTILSVCTTTEDQDFVWLGTTATVGRVRVDNATVQGTASTVDTWNINAWNHLVGVFTNSTSRSVLLNGGTKGTNATDVAMPGGLNNTALGRLNQSSATYETSGRLAEVGLWNVALTDADQAALADGYSPDQVRPESLVAYWPLIRDTDIDIVGGYTLTANNAPTVADHAPMIYAAQGHSMPLRVIPDAEIVWGHDTGVAEATVRNFQYNWTGTGGLQNAGQDDVESLELSSGEYMISEVVNTGAVDVEILYNVYVAGDDIDLDYRTGANRTACQVAAWNNYVASFLSSGFVQVRVTSLL